MTSLVFLGYVVVICHLATCVRGENVTEEPQTTTTDLPSSEGSWYVDPAILWSSAAAFLLLMIIIFVLCFIRRLKHAEPRPGRFYNPHEAHKRPKRYKRRYRKPKSSRTKSNSHGRIDNSRGGSAAVDQRDVKVSGPGSHCHRSDVDSEVFNISKINPVYEFDGDKEPLPKPALFESNYGGDVQSRVSNLSQGRAVRGYYASSFSGLPAPSMATTDPNVIYVKTELANTHVSSGSLQPRSRESPYDQPYVQIVRKSSFEDSELNIRPSTVAGPSNIEDTYIVPIPDTEMLLKASQVSPGSSKEDRKHDDAKRSGCGIVGKKLENLISYHPPKPTS